MNSIGGKYSLQAVTAEQVASETHEHQGFPECITRLVTEWATVTPDAIALVKDEQMISYGELNLRANQIARYLQAQGLRRGEIVALCIERSIETVIGLLAILKAGCAYLPLDPSYPPERLAFILEDANVRIVLTQEKLLMRIPEKQARSICLDADRALWRQYNGSDPEIASFIYEVAYVIYTSGSTGYPKGVQVTHRNLLHLVDWHITAFQVTTEDRASQVAGPAFDAMVWELWPYLSIGACITFAEDDVRTVPALLRDWLIKHNITIAFVPTVLAGELIQANWPSFTRLHTLLTGADVLTHHPRPGLPFVLVNNYGPTETTVVATSGIVPPLEQPEHIPTIGKPIKNTRIYILDERLAEVPVGVTGEIYIGGSSVSLGYLNRVELTAARFVPDPFSDIPGSRLYKTGDIAFLMDDGQIMFIGRNDHQVKVAGYRVELNEIMLALNRQPEIRDCIVTVRDVQGKGKSIVAYLVAQEDSTPQVSRLRRSLARRLPHYMIPSFFIQMEALPTTPNGKIDLAALPEPEEANILQDTASSLAVTPTEEKVMEIISSLLGLTGLSIQDNFFLLGGNSLLGTQIITRLSREFGIDIPLRAIFASATVQKLAALVDEMCQKK
uniref:Carrier domain-containing protein n=1 Tax=Thermosporothrix sp. COM3 TaxID=2490863 RepID=A0A455SK30_9CHLR|nr:hypothetical protein KTC_28470 [Thermosporothrix sp. COM3]